MDVSIAASDLGASISCMGGYESMIEIEHIYLKSIESYDFKFLFHTSNQSDYSDCVQLDSINLISNLTNETIKKVFLKYEGKRIFLKSIKEWDKPPYEFSYNGDATQIEYDFNAVDHWGYYNGESRFGLLKAGSMICPIISFNGNAYFGLLRETNPVFINAGTLSQINYPTGAIDKFEFEANTCSRYGVSKGHGEVSFTSVARCWSSDWEKKIDFLNGRLTVESPTYITLSFTPKNETKVVNIRKLLTPGTTYSFSSLLLEQGIQGNIEDYFYSLDCKQLERSDYMYVGGVRIKKITRISDYNTINYEYKYVNDYEFKHFQLNEENSTSSSGLLGLLPRYDYSPLGIDYRAFCSQQITPLSHTKGSHIGYSEVAEIISDGFGKKIGTKFINIRTLTRIQTIHQYTNIVVLHYPIMM